MRGRIVILALVLAGAFAATGAAVAAPFQALAGAEAEAYRLPGDVRLVKTLPLADGGTYERYQQVFGRLGARVLGGQITVYRDRDGRVTSVVGAHYSDITPTNGVDVAPADARFAAGRDVGRATKRLTALVINPANGRYLFRVESKSLGERWFHYVDAETGEITRRIDAVEDDHGIGVKGDVKDMDGPNNTSTTDDLTTYHGAKGHGANGKHWDLFAKDNRQKTYNARNQTRFLYYATDSDNHWTTTGSSSPGHPALVDAQYYANVTDDYLLGRIGLNWLSCYPAGMQSVAHFGRNYNNAFWDGTYTVYGDGDGVQFRNMSGALDVVSHEYTHGVTDCTSQLVYQNESGALNEAFSDMLGSSTEYYAAANTLDTAAAPDWWIGEDIYLPADAAPGIRNMADPAEDSDPDHYSERYTGTEDNGGVHTNSGIPNHAYYLLVNGGRNAGEARGHAHSGPTVVGIGLADAERIFYRGFTGLSSTATMCQARKTTEAQASSLFGSASQQHASTIAAWDAVGVPTSC